MPPPPNSRLSRYIACHCGRRASWHDPKTMEHTCDYHTQFHVPWWLYHCELVDAQGAPAPDVRH